MKFVICLLFLFPLLCVSYDAKTLKVKDYEEMRDILSQYIKRSREKAPEESAGAGLEEAVSELKKGLKVLFMRPDTDNINSSLLLVIQNEISSHRSFMPVFKEIVENSVTEFKSKRGSVSYQASLLYLIENAISYLQSINTAESTEILTNIKTADLKISKALSNYLILEMGRGKTANPSYLAQRVLAKRFKENKLAEARKKDLEKQAQKEKKDESVDKADKRNPSSVESESSLKPTVEVEL